MLKGEGLLIACAQQCHSVCECLLEKSPKKKSAGVRTFEGRIYFVDFGSEKIIHQNILISVGTLAWVGG
jgi:hypothetical protein